MKRIWNPYLSYQLDLVAPGAEERVGECDSVEDGGFGFGGGGGGFI